MGLRRREQKRRELVGVQAGVRRARSSRLAEVQQKRNPEAVLVAAAGRKRSGRQSSSQGVSGQAGGGEVQVAVGRMRCRAGIFK
jgi:hypothetical protein